MAAKKTNQPYELLLDTDAPVLRRKTSASGVLGLSDVLLPSTLTKRPSGPLNKIPAAAQLSATAQARQRDKFVPLPKALETSEEADSDSGAVIAEVEEPLRITVYCLAERFNRKQLEALLNKSYTPQDITLYDDVIELSLSTGRNAQDAFFFDFGVFITFGLDQKQQKTLMDDYVTPVKINPHPKSEVDSFKLATSTEPPHIKNDCFTVNKRQAQTHTVRLAIAHALAQSSKLSVYEQQVWGLVEATKPLPMSLAKTGRVPVSTKQVAKLIGRVFLQNANVNLLSSVLDTPEFFSSAPDSLHSLYERACEYLELQTRIEILNGRFQVLQEMLDMLRSHQNNEHASRLEYIVIWLLGVDCVLMLFQAFGFTNQSLGAYATYIRT